MFFMAFLSDEKIGTLQKNAKLAYLLDILSSCMQQQGCGFFTKTALWIMLPFFFLGGFLVMCVLFF
jgi:hypothetical protein